MSTTLYTGESPANTMTDNDNEVPSWVEGLDEVTHAGKVENATVEDGEAVIKFFSGHIANTYYTVRVPLDAVEAETR